MWLKAWELVDRDDVPGTERPMELLRCEQELAIRVDGRELMRTGIHGSEDALADLACARLRDRSDARVLIGGLGMGYTLAAALRGVGPDARVVVAELVPAVVRWNRGPLAHAAGRPLDDPRASVHLGDVAELIREAPGRWDAILLDVDNGPTGLTRGSNDWLYTWRGLDAAFDALSPGGVLGVWSGWPDPGFTRRVARAGFDVAPIEVRARGERGGAVHVVWIGVRRSEAPEHRRRASGA